MSHNQARPDVKAKWNPLTQPSRNSSHDTIYAQLFTRYARNTDGKLRLARALADIFQTTSRGRLLDLGAGDGTLTGMIAPHFAETVAVERNPKFLVHLDAIPRCSPQHATIEQFVESDSGLYDVILLSYSMTGVPDDQLDRVIKRLHDLRAANGKILLCSFDDACEWSRFASAASKQCGTVLKGGTSCYLAKLEKAGAHASVVRQVRTLIWDENIPALTDLMAFFFVNRLPLYLRHIAAITRQVEQHSFDQIAEGGRRRAMRVIENIIEVR